MKVALIHDWLTGMRGGEYVLEAISELYPDADLYTLVCDPDKISDQLKRHRIYTSWLQKIPGAVEKYRHFLPLMPRAIESFDLSAYDLVISSSHCVAKGVRKAPHARHVSYVHAPMRYMWDRYDDYFGPGKASLPVRLATRLVRKNLQDWDRQVSQPHRVDAMMANSQFIADKIKQFYGREAQVVYPFADLSRFQLSRKVDGFYLVLGALAPYKRVDLAIEAFNQLKLPLWIAGHGQDFEKLKPLAGPTIKFLGSVPNEVVSELYSQCKALIFPGVEDFGITPLEAMASGAPVIAYGHGGAQETVTEKTGIHFAAQNASSLAEAVLKLETGKVVIDENDCRARAALFTKERFQKVVHTFLSSPAS